MMNVRPSDHIYYRFHAGFLINMFLLNDLDALISLGQSTYQGNEGLSVVEVSVNVVGTLETTVHAK